MGLLQSLRGEAQSSHYDGAWLLHWIPAFAGMTTYGSRALYAVQRVGLVLANGVALGWIAFGKTQMSFVDAS